MQICLLKLFLLIVAFPWNRSRLLYASPRSSGPVAQLLRELKVAEEKYATLELENQNLRVELHASNVEIHRLKDQLVQQQLANNARVGRVLNMLASASTKPSQSST